tara:strand:+ start:62 stop:340 length:279 start_codon:yes stop_codon:yes gene_type:complete
MSPEIKDFDGDGRVSEQEALLSSKLEKDDTMREQSWVALIAMVVYPLLAFAPVSVERLSTISSISDMFYIAMTGVIGAGYGSQVVMKKNGIK